MHDAYDARDPEGMGWYEDAAWQRGRRPPANGADRWPPPFAAGEDGGDPTVRGPFDAPPGDRDPAARGPLDAPRAEREPRATGDDAGAGRFAASAGDGGTMPFTPPAGRGGDAGAGRFAAPAGDGGTARFAPPDAEDRAGDRSGRFGSPGAQGPPWSTGERGGFDRPPADRSLRERRQASDASGPGARPAEARPGEQTGHAPPPPGPASFDPQRARRSAGAHDRAAQAGDGDLRPRQPFTADGLDRGDGHDDRVLARSAPAAAEPPPERAPSRHPGAPDDRAPAQARDEAVPPDRGGASRHRRGRDAADVEQAQPAGQQLRESVDNASTRVRRSVPLRTLLFVLPPLVLPALAFDLSVTAIVVVALLLLWLAAAAGAFATIMLEGSQKLTLRALGEKVDQLSARGAGGSVAAPRATSDDAVQEALMALGRQLDRLDQRVGALTPSPGRPTSEPGAAPSHRPQDFASNTVRDEQYDRYGQPAAPDTNWGESRWRR